MHYETYTLTGATFAGKQIYGARDFILDMDAKKATVTAGFWDLSYEKKTGKLEAKFSARSEHGAPLILTLTLNVMDFGFERMETGQKTGGLYKFSGQIYHMQEPTLEEITRVVKPPVIAPKTF